MRFNLKTIIPAGILQGRPREPGYTDCVYSRAEQFGRPMSYCPLSFGPTAAKSCPCRTRQTRGFSTEADQSVRVIACLYPSNWKGEKIAEVVREDPQEPAPPPSDSDPY